VSATLEQRALLATSCHILYKLGLSDYLGHPSARLDRCLHKRHHALIGVVVDAAQSNPTEAFGLQHFHRQNDQHFACLVLAPHRRNRLLAVGDGQVSLVDFDLTLQAVSVRPHHRAAEPMQHGPGCLVAPEPEHTLQAQGAHALLLVRQVPRCCQPHA